MVLRPSSDSSQAITIARFERLLLLGDATSLSSLDIPDAASVARGDYAFLISPPTNTSPLSAQIAYHCISLTDAPTTAPSLLNETLRSAASGSLPDLYAIYTAGVGLLNAFISANWVGPPVSSETSAADAAAALLLTTNGEDVARPARHLTWLRAARRILVDSIEVLVQCGLTLVPWWAARALLAQQGILYGLAPDLRYATFTMFGRFLGNEVAQARELFAEPQQEKVEESDDEDDDWMPAPTEGGGDIHDEEDDFVQVLNEQDSTDRRLLVLAYLELSIAQKLYYDGDGALVSLRKACRYEGIAFCITGEMGVRTKFQTKATAQLIARAFEIAGDPAHVGGDWEDFAVQFPIETTRENGEGAREGADSAASLPLPKNVPVDDTDVLGYIRLTGDKESAVTASDQGNDSDTEDEEVSFGDEKEHLTPIQQALALGQAAVVRARNASHILTREEMAPYVNLVIGNTKSPLGTSSVVQVRALMLRVTFERERGRYLERCMSQMEEVGRFVDDQMDTLDERCRHAAIAERNLLLFASSVPPRWELKKELAISFGKMGLVKSAMEIFEKLEYWDELVDCHRLIGNLGHAETLVREQLEMLDEAVLEDGLLDESEIASGVLQFGSKGAVHARAARRPRLLCVLGDVTRNKEHFETAWSESGCRYGRAKRALGRMCVEASEWEEAVAHFKEALAVNSLFPDVWFTYGCAAIQIRNMQLAAHAFTRVVQQTPENGEAWNNLARVLHELGKKKQALKALSEAAKTKRDSWHIWDNMLMLATEIRSSPDMVRAMERLLEIRGKDGIVAESIGVAVAEVVRMTGSEDVEDKARVGPVCRKLLKVLGRSTTLVSTNPSIWAAYAQLHELVPSAGGKQKAFDCRLKQVRSLIAQAQWKSNLRDFRHMVLASESLAQDAVLTENSLNLRAARLHLRSVIEQTSEDFLQDEGFSRLQEAERSLEVQTDSGHCL